MVVQREDTSNNRFDKIVSSTSIRSFQAVPFESNTTINVQVSTEQSHSDEASNTSAIRVQEIPSGSVQKVRSKFESMFSFANPFVFSI